MLELYPEDRFVTRTFKKFNHGHIQTYSTFGALQEVTIDCAE